MFSEPVDVDTAWVPTIHDKSDGQKDAIRAVIARNILFASLDSEQVCVRGERVLAEARVWVWSLAVGVGACSGPGCVGAWVRGCVGGWVSVALGFGRGGGGGSLPKGNHHACGQLPFGLPLLMLLNWSLIWCLLRAHVA